MTDLKNLDQEDGVVEKRQSKASVPEQLSSDRRTAILQSARRVLIEEGYPSFTLRRIASYAHIHLKTLQHYFTNKRELLLETVHYTLNEYYFTQYQKVAEEIGARQPREGLARSITYLIEDCKSEDTSKFFFELWALASRDEDACEALDALYTRHRHQIELLLGRANPRLRRDELQLRATLIAAQIEGLMVFIGYGKPRHAAFDELENEAHAQIMNYAFAKNSSQEDPK